MLIESEANPSGLVSKLRHFLRQVLSLIQAIMNRRQDHRAIKLQ